MITFRITQQSFQKNTFFCKKTTPIAKSLNAFGYLKGFNKDGKAIVDWYYNFVRSEILFTTKELKEGYKSIYPYYNTKTVRGNIWKYSYTTLLKNICPNRGFSQIKVDKLTYKITPIKGNKVIINDAVYVLKNGITDLYGKIVTVHNGSCNIKTSQGVFSVKRNSFTILPQDYFILLSIRCN